MLTAGDPSRYVPTPRLKGEIVVRSEVQKGVGQKVLKVDKRKTSKELKDE